MYAKKQRPPPTPPFEGLKLGRMLAHSEGVKVYQGRHRGSNVIVRVRAAPWSARPLHVEVSRCCECMRVRGIRQACCACAEGVHVGASRCCGCMRVRGMQVCQTPPQPLTVGVRVRAQLFKDATWLRSLHGIPLEAAISAAHPHPNLARCSAMRRRGGSSGGDGIWTFTESFERSLQARAPLCAHLRAGQ